MYKEYVIVFMDVDIDKIQHDCFMGKTENGAIREFKEVYRHGNYKILSIVPTGRK